VIKTLLVLGFQDNDIDANSSSIDGWVDAAHSDIEYAKEENPGNVQVRTVGKFTIENAEIEGAQTYVVCLKTKPIGVLILHRNDDRVWATETIGVLPEYQGQNLGTLLYETALADIGKLGSSTSLSGGSSKVWKALCLKHKGVFVIPEDYTSSGKALEVQIKGWVLEGGVTYPVFSKADGTTITLRVLLATGSKAAKEGYYLLKAFGGGSKVSENWPLN
jgi:GNAT superfamily N-acetyltransferase